MDPNATLEELRAIVARILGAWDRGDEDAEILAAVDVVIRLAELVQALDEWLSKGGFLPRPWHEALTKGRVAVLTRLLEDLAEDCDQRADADCTGDPPEYRPNFAMQLLTKIRAVVPR